MESKKSKDSTAIIEFSLLKKIKQANIIINIKIITIKIIFNFLRPIFLK